MMNYKGLIAIAMMTTLVMGACSKSSDDAVPEVVASMSATINETSLGDSTQITSSAQWDAISRVSLVKNNILTITGTSLNLMALTNPDVIVLTVNGLKEGTYNLGLGTLSAQCACALTTKYLEKYPSVFLSTSGKVVLTKVDTAAKQVSGTFEFTLYSGVFKTISAGKFENLTYSVQ